MKHALCSLLLVPLALHAQSAADTASRSFQNQISAEAQRIEDQRQWNNMQSQFDRLDAIYTKGRTIALYPPRIPTFLDPLPPITQSQVHAPRIIRENNQTHFNLTNLSAKLAPFAFEPAYHPLSRVFSHLDDPTPKSLRKRLDLYLEARRQLVDSLQQTLAALPSTEALASFAATQAEALDALEKESEAILADAIAVDSSNNRPDPYEVAPENRTPNNDASFLRLLSIYQPGLSLPQRQLLRLHVQSLTTPPSPVALHAPLITLPPFGSVFPLPTNLPTETLSLLTAYQTQSDALLSNLVETARAQEKTIFGSSRTKAFRALAEKQAPLFAQLDALAESIRPVIAPLVTAPALPAHLALTPDFLARLQRNHASRNSLFQTQEKTILQLAATYPNASLRTQLTFNRLALVLHSDPIFAKSKAHAALLAELTPFNETQTAAYQAILAERAALEREHQTLAAAHANLPTFAQLLQALDQQALWERYRDYYHAVLTPGLSPAQRRLLFAEALAHLQ